MCAARINGHYASKANPRLSYVPSLYLKTVRDSFHESVRLRSGETSASELFFLAGGCLDHASFNVWSVFLALTVSYVLAAAVV